MPRKFKKDAKTQVHRMDNVNQALKMVEKAEVKTTFLKAQNLLDADFKMLCGMVWNIILDYNIKGISVEDTTAKQGLLIWCRKKTKGYQGVDGKIDNFSKDWKNGNAFLALVDRHTTGMVDYDGMYDQSPEEKLDAAFTACEQLGIMRLLEVEDLTEVERPDEKAVMTYVSELFKLFSKEDIKENAAQHISNFLAFQRRIDGLAGDYEARFKDFEEWVHSKCNHFGSQDAPSDQVNCGTAMDDFKTYLMDEKPTRMADVVDIQDLYANIQGELKVNGRSAYSPGDDFDPHKLVDLINELQNAENEYTEMVRDAKLGFISKMETDGISEERMAEFERSFDAFDADKSGHLDKIEFKAALSAVGIALSDDADVDRVFSELSSEGFVERDAYLAYLEQFFSTSDDADSLMKSLQTLGDPENVSEEMLQQPPLTDDDVAYLMSKSEDGSLAAFIQASFN